MTLNTSTLYGEWHEMRRVGWIQTLHARRLKMEWRQSGRSAGSAFLPLVSRILADTGHGTPWLLWLARAPLVLASDWR